MANSDPRSPGNPAGPSSPAGPAASSPSPATPPERTVSISASPAGGLEPTQSLPAQGSSSPESPPAASPLQDAARRRQLEADLARMGLTPEQIRRMLDTETNATGPSGAPALPSGRQPSAGPPAARVTPASGRGRMTEAELFSYAAGLAATSPQARDRPPESVPVDLPPFRTSSPEELRQAEQLLRDANLLRRRERYREAEAKCREALNLVPKDAAALELLADLLQGVARTDEALAVYKRAVEADPKRASAERKYGDLLVRQQNWEPGSVEVDPINTWIAVMLSLFLPGLGQFFNKDWAKGIFFLIVDVVCVYLLFQSPWGFQHRGGGITTSMMAMMILTVVIYIVAIVDAQITAKRGRRRGGSSGWDV